MVSEAFNIRTGEISSPTEGERIFIFHDNGKHRVYFEFSTFQFKIDIINWSYFCECFLRATKNSKFIHCNHSAFDLYFEEVDGDGRNIDFHFNNGNTFLFSMTNENIQKFSDFIHSI